jgi:hypothetical protein
VSLASLILKPARLGSSSQGDLSIVSNDDSKLALAPIQSLDLEHQYEVLIDKPIFHQDRHYLAPAKIDTTPAIPIPQYQITGFFAVPGRPAKSFLKSMTDSRTLSLAVGDKVDGWTVMAMTAKEVTLQLGVRTVAITKSGPSAVFGAAETTTPDPQSSTERPTAVISAPAAPSPALQNLMAAPPSPQPSSESGDVQGVVPPAGAQNSGAPAAISNALNPIATVLPTVEVQSVRSQPRTFAPPAATGP